MHEIQEIEITQENLRQILLQMTEEDAIQAMQELANAHGLAIATIPVPDGADKMEFIRGVMEKFEKITGREAENLTHGPTPVDLLNKMLKQKAEMEKASMQHCEHNSRAGLALQVIGVSMNSDKEVDDQPESFRKMFDTACNTLRDAMIGTPIE